MLCVCHIQTVLVPFHFLKIFVYYLAGSGLSRGTQGLLFGRIHQGSPRIYFLSWSCFSSSIYIIFSLYSYSVSGVLTIIPQYHLFFSLRSNTLRALQFFPKEQGNREDSPGAGFVRQLGLCSPFEGSLVVLEQRSHCLAPVGRWISFCWVDNFWLQIHAPLRTCLEPPLLQEAAFLSTCPASLMRLATVSPNSQWRRKTLG